MKTLLASTARFHFISAAVELKKRGMLAGVVTGLLPSRVNEPRLETDDVVTVPFWRTLNYLSMGRVSQSLERWLEWKSNDEVDRTATCYLDGCQSLITMAGTGIKAGAVIQRQGGSFLVDRPVIHIRQQEQILAEAYEAAKVDYHPIDPSKIESGEEEYAMADGILASSRLVARTLVDGGVSSSKVFVLPLGVDLGRFYVEGNPADGPFTLGFAGAVSIQKGIHVVTEALKILSDRTIRLWIAGQILEEGKPFLKQMESLCELEVLGPVSQEVLRRRFSESHGFMLPSVQDGFGMVVTQAMACGCPVIVSRNAGASEAVEEGESGLLFDSGDSAALAKKIGRLRDDREFGRYLGQNGLRAVSRIGGWDAYGDGLAEVLMSFHDGRSSELSWKASGMSA